jgi:hypothetical protein
MFHTFASYTEFKREHPLQSSAPDARMRPRSKERVADERLWAYAQQQP